MFKLCKMSYCIFQESLYPELQYMSNGLTSEILEKFPAIFRVVGLLLGNSICKMSRKPVDN